MLRDVGGGGVTVDVCAIVFKSVWQWQCQDNNDLSFSPAEEDLSTSLTLEESKTDLFYASSSAYQTNLQEVPSWEIKTEKSSQEASWAGVDMPLCSLATLWLHSSWQGALENPPVKGDWPKHVT